MPVKSAVEKSSVSTSVTAVPPSVVNIALHVSVVPAQLQPMSLDMGVQLLPPSPPQVTVAGTPRSLVGGQLELLPDAGVTVRL